MCFVIVKQEIHQTRLCAIQEIWRLNYKKVGVVCREWYRSRICRGFERSNLEVCDHMVARRCQNSGGRGINWNRGMWCLWKWRCWRGKRIKSVLKWVVVGWRCWVCFAELKGRIGAEDGEVIVEEDMGVIVDGVLSS